MSLKLRMGVRRALNQYGRLRAMPWRHAVRYLVAGMLRQHEPREFSVLGYDVHLRPGTTDLAVACESLGAELEPAISYFPDTFDGTIIDAGGYIGTSTLKFAKAFPAARIIVLEPSKENHAVLSLNLAGIANVHVLNAALSDHDGEIDLIDRSTGNWGFTIVPNPSDAHKAVPVGKTKVISVESLCKEHGIKDIGIFKIDIEGGEAQLFQSPDSWLDRTELVIIELHEWIVPGVEGVFRERTRSLGNLKLPGEKYLSMRRVVAQDRLI